jgi:type IV secretory pathway component VirB8
VENINQENQEKNQDQAKERYDAIRESVESGEYFKDGLNWYFFRYVNPFCERTIFFISCTLIALMFYMLFNMIESSYPLVRKVPIVVKAVDESMYFPYLIKLKQDNQNARSVDEAVLSYLLKKYVMNREDHNYSDAEIEPINLKFNKIRNTSSSAEYQNFQNFMSKNNPSSPIYDFGKDAYRKIDIESINFIENNPKTFSDKAKSFLVDTIPTDAEVRYTLYYKHDTGEVTSQKFLVKINFTFAGIHRKEDNDTDSSLQFRVNSYNTYIIQ